SPGQPGLRASWPLTGAGTEPGDVGVPRTIRLVVMRPEVAADHRGDDARGDPELHRAAAVPRRRQGRHAGARREIDRVRRDQRSQDLGGPIAGELADLAEPGPAIAPGLPQDLAVDREQQDRVVDVDE